MKALNEKIQTFLHLISTAPLCWFLTGLTVVLLTRHFVCEPILVTGRSMFPTLRSGRVTFVNKMAYVFQGPRRGDIVAVWDGREIIVKRVVGLPGEEISAKASMFFVNGASIQEPYVESHASWNVSSGKMPEDQFVLAGDNRADSVVVVVSRDRIVGRVLN